MKPIEPGQRWELPCPFLKDVANGIYEQILSWRPGRSEDQYGERDDGMGVEIRDVIAVVDLPEPYQPRVFYRRTWRAPDGHTFGRKELRCTAKPAFRSWCNNGPYWNQQWRTGGAAVIVEVEA